MADTSLDEETLDDTAAAMAAAMGFSGFGTQNRPSKKRKFNPQADATVSSAASSFSPDAGTGANNAPLGERRKPQPSLLPSRPGNADEIISLGGDDQHHDAADGSPNLAGGEGDDPDILRYLDTSRPSRGYLPEELAEMEAQARIDAIISGAGGGGGGGGGGSEAPAAEHRNFHHSGRGGNERLGPRGAGHHGRRGDAAAERKPWWEGYYDAKVNENPWARLEKQRGLGPRGAWISRSEAEAAAVSGTAARASVLVEAGSDDDAAPAAVEANLQPKQERS